MAGRLKVTTGDGWNWFWNVSKVDFGISSVEPSGSAITVIPRYKSGMRSWKSGLKSKRRKPKTIFP
jgi:hypothetical protein